MVRQKFPLSRRCRKFSIEDSPGGEHNPTYQERYGRAKNVVCSPFFILEGWILLSRSAAFSCDVMVRARLGSLVAF